MALTAAERNRQMRLRRKARGLVKFEVYLRPETMALIKAVIAAMEKRLSK